MGRFSDVLFSADFDHTLSGPDGSVPQRNVDAIQEFIAEGGRFCINSGRSVPLLRSKVELVPVNAPCLCFNGAACYDFAAEKLLYAVPLPANTPQLIGQIRALGDDFGIELQCLDRHYFYRASAREQFLRKQGIISLPAEANFPELAMKLVLYAALDADVLSAKATPEQSVRMEQLKAQLEALCGESCYVVRSLPLQFEIGPRSCDKGSAARALADSLGRRVVVCAGDAPNDLQMLQAADFAFVPSDADEEILALPGVRVAAPSGEGAVADAIEQLKALL